MKKIQLITITLLIIVLIACNKHDLPSVNTPVIDDVAVNNTVEIWFEIFTDAGYHSSDVSADVGIAVHSGDLGSGAVQGIVIVKYTAGSAPGTDYISLTVHDLDGNQATRRVSLKVVENN
jgi:hypothetical protein